uniref:Uncharacterized protein n=1 Tax=Anguilla anguilla TaxID=7936 RepID=A0A0E9WFS7_ANGAN
MYLSFVNNYEFCYDGFTDETVLVLASLWIYPPFFIYLIWYFQHMVVSKLTPGFW